MINLKLSTNDHFDLIHYNNAICITGTDTGIGKTVATGLIAKKLKQKASVVTQKWIQSGDLDSPDINTHDQLSGIKMNSKWENDRQVYSFHTPASPHLAAAVEGKTIETSRIVDATNRLTQHFDIVLVETSGGIMVPLNQTLTVGDVVTQMKLPTIIVVPNKLGTINHTLLTAHYIKQNNIPLLGFIVNNFGKPTTDIEKDNPSIISQIIDAPCLGTVQ